jgi:hypothetical protein
LTGPEPTVVEFDPHVIIALILLIFSIMILLLLMAFLANEHDKGKRKR